MAAQSSVELIFTDPIPMLEKGLMNGISTTLVKIVNESKSLCPVGEYPEGSGKSGGRLRNSLMMKVPGFEYGLNNYPGEKNSDKIDVNPMGLEGFAGLHVYYAVYRHFGTRNMGGIPFLSAAIAIWGYGQSAKIVREKLNFLMAHAKNFKETKRVRFY
jgi:hypothetical protein